jgi:hypothetical protein
VARTSYVGVNISDFDIRAASQGDINDEIFGICGNLTVVAKCCTKILLRFLLPLSATIVPIKARIFCNHRSTASEVNAFSCLQNVAPKYCYDFCLLCQLPLSP